MVSLPAVAIITIAVFATIGWLWITGLAMVKGDTLWCVGCLFIPVLTLVYGWQNYARAKTPVWFVTVGAAAHLLLQYVGLGLLKLN